MSNVGGGMGPIARRNIDRDQIAAADGAYGSILPAAVKPACHFGNGIARDTKRCFMNATLHMFDAGGTGVPTTRHKRDPRVTSSGVYASFLARFRHQRRAVDDCDFAARGQVDDAIGLEFGELAADGLDRQPQHIGDLLA
jgi:hypothetical protein